MYLLCTYHIVARYLHLLMPYFWFWEGRILIVPPVIQLHPENIRDSPWRPDFQSHPHHLNGIPLVLGILYDFKWYPWRYLKSFGKPKLLSLSCNAVSTTSGVDLSRTRRARARERFVLLGKLGKKEALSECRAFFDVYKDYQRVYYVIFQGSFWVWTAQQLWSCMDCPQSPAQVYGMSLQALEKSDWYRLINIFLECHQSGDWHLFV